MNSPNDYIAVFDSGLGGISVLQCLRSRMPGERFLYFGDSANAPYGSRPTEQILELTLAAVEKIMTRPVKALVIACNTATAVAVDTLREKYPDLVIVGTEPAVAVGARMFPGGTVGVMATPATLGSPRILSLIARKAGDARVELLPVAELAAIVEQGKENDPQTVALLKNYLDPVKDSLDALVLGCTHYPFAAPAIREALGREIPLLDGGEAIARRTQQLLEEKQLLSPGNGELVWENTLGTPRILALSRRLLDTRIDL